MEGQNNQYIGDKDVSMEKQLALTRLNNQHEAKKKKNSNELGTDWLCTWSCNFCKDSFLMSIC